MSAKMDFDYERHKDSESRQRQERLCSQLNQKPRPLPRPSISATPPTGCKPPIKPRRSIKCRPTAQRETEQSSCQAIQENEVVVKRIDPSQVLGPGVSLEAQTPSLRAHILLWFQKTQLPHLQKHGRPLPGWLHGFATRREAEQLLQDKPQGCFLLRLSESKIGFVLSYRGADRCRHFIIEEESEVSGMNSQYVIAGENSRHGSLEELIDYYSHNPVGPFNETLTVPCVQPITQSEEIVKHEDKHREGEDDENEEKTKASLLSIPENPPAEPGCKIPHAASESAEYAVVRKALKKANSLPESQSVPYTAPNGDQNGLQEHESDSVITPIEGDLSQPTDAPYARVNKPPRATPQPTSISNTDFSIQGAAAADTHQSFHSSASSAEQKYWELEPPHTYEETPHTRTRNEEIDFYAIGRRRDIPGGPELFGDHLYSEVNVKGSRDGIIPASPPNRPAAVMNSTPLGAWPNPSLLLRAAHAPLRSEENVQSSAGSPTMTSQFLSGYNQSERLLTENSPFSIYEQIPERPANSRAPLPLSNPKR